MGWLLRSHNAHTPPASMLNESTMLCLCCHDGVAPMEMLKVAAVGSNDVSEDLLLASSDGDDTEEFCIELDKGANMRAAGLCVSIVDSVGVLIHDVKDGLAQDWNNSHPEQRIQKDDIVIEVNGVKAKPAVFVWLLKSENVLTMTLRRAKTFAVVIDREEGPQHLGLSFTHLVGDATLLVESVGPGLIQQWNEANEDSVKKGDRIIKVNDVCNNAGKMFGLIAGARYLNVIVFRLCNPLRSHKDATTNDFPALLS